MDGVGQGQKGRFAGWGGLGLIALLAGCASAPPTSEQSTEPPVAGVTSDALPVLPPAGSGRGGYYLDDGPGDAPPDGLLAMPDATPRIEPYGRRGNRPYVVFGTRYTPFVDERPYKERGRGSWYGKKFHGQKTSSGEIYDMYKMTAAHPTLPLPSYARVTNLENGRKVIVRVNDRGPFLAGRIIDLSYTAALKLGYLEKGSAMLEVERLLPEEIQRMLAERRDGTSGSPNEESVVVAGVEQPDAPTRSALASDPATPAALVAPALPSTGIYLQLGAFAQADNAEAARTRFSAHPEVMLAPVSVVGQGSLHRVYSGPYASRAEAEAIAQRLQQREALTPMVVQR